MPRTATRATTMSAAAFAVLGVERLAYIKAVRSDEVAFRRVRHGRFAAVSEHDGRAVGRVQHEHAVTGWEQRCFRAQECNLLRADRPDIGNAILTQGRECFGRHRRAGHCGRIEHDTCSSRWDRA